MRGEGSPVSWVGDKWLALPPQPHTAARLSSAPGNALGFLGTMPECMREARGDTFLPEEVVLPAAFPVCQWGRKPP